MTTNLDHPTHGPTPQWFRTLARDCGAIQTAWIDLRSGGTVLAFWASEDDTRDIEAKLTGYQLHWTSLMTTGDPGNPSGIRRYEFSPELTREQLAGELR